MSVARAACSTLRKPGCLSKAAALSTRREESLSRCVRMPPDLLEATTVEMAKAANVCVSVRIRFYSKDPSPQRCLNVPEQAFGAVVASSHFVVSPRLLGDVFRECPLLRFSLASGAPQNSCGCEQLCPCLTPASNGFCKAPAAALKAWPPSGARMQPRRICFRRGPKTSSRDSGGVPRLPCDTLGCNGVAVHSLLLRPFKTNVLGRAFLG